MTRRTLPVALACAALSMGCNAPLFAFYFPVRGVVTEAPPVGTDALAGAGTPSPDPIADATHSVGQPATVGPCCLASPTSVPQTALEGELEFKSSPLPVPELPLGRAVAQ